MTNMLSAKTFAYQAVLAIALGLASSTPLHAAPQVYTVEVIVFKNLTGTPADAEIWTRANQEPLPEADLDLPENISPPKPMPAVKYTVLRDGERSLNGLAGKLEATGRYEVLLHQAWRQPGLEREKAAPVHIELPLGTTRGNAAPTVHASLPDGTGVGQGWNSPPEAKLEGDLTLILSRFLHLEADLRYYTGEVLQPINAVQDQFAELVTQPQVYRLKQERRMRSGELHYIDHPAFGLLAVVKPYEP